MKASTKKRIAIIKAKRRILEAEKEERRLRRLSRPDRPPEAVVCLGDTIQCQNCAREVLKTSSNQRYCSPKCRLKFQQRFPVSDKYKRWMADKLLDPLKGAVKQRRGSKFFGKCIICGDEFERRSPVQKYCPHHGRKMRLTSYRRKIMEGLAEQIAKEQVEGGFVE